MRLVITRPEPDASRTAHAVRALGHQALVAPLLAMRAIRDVRLPKRRFQGLILTSANALRALQTHPEKDLVSALPVYAVGDATALAARRAGFARAVSAGSDVAGLVAHVRAAVPAQAGPLLHLCGDVVAGDPGALLAADGFRVQSVAIYAMDPAEVLPEAVQSALREGAVDGILLYSRRTAAVFAVALRRAGLAPLEPSVSCYCLSQAIADTVAPVVAGTVHVAAAPTQIDLFACLKD